MCRALKMIKPGEVLGASFVWGLYFAKYDMIESYAEALYLALYEDKPTLFEVPDNDRDRDRDNDADD